MEKLFRHINPVTAIDIGAHTGEFTKSLTHRYPNCRIIMIEANPNCEPYLKLLSKPYHLFAISDKAGYSDLYIEKFNHIGTGASVYKEKTHWYEEGKYETVRIETKTLDSLNLFQGEEIDYIKLDVQGSELDVINGGVETLKRTNFISAELSLLEYNEKAPMIDVVVDRLYELDFRMLDIIEYHRFENMYNGAYFQLDILFNRN